MSFQPWSVSELFVPFCSLSGIKLIPIPSRRPASRRTPLRMGAIAERSVVHRRVVSQCDKLRRAGGDAG